MDIAINYKVDKAEVAAAVAEVERLTRATSSAASSVDNLSASAQKGTAPTAKMRDELGRFVKNTNDASSAANKAGKEFGQLNTTFMSLGNIIKGVGLTIIAQQIVDVTKRIIETRAEFQRFEAVLSNTLGSRSAALRVFSMINDFASKTPFQVDELTGSFVKLANQGFTPTINQMRSLGDLAASTGKPFDQLVEAIIDAQTAEFERLKEFGIRAKNQGDTIAFTFKGVTTEVGNTSKAIREYILSLGDAEGVTGAMDKISETLGGKLSNLDDNFTTLFNNLGKLIENEGSAAISWFSDLIGKINEIVEKQVDPFGGFVVSTDNIQEMEAAAARIRALILTTSEEFERVNSLPAVSAEAKMRKAMVEAQMRDLQNAYGQQLKIIDDYKKEIAKRSKEDEGTVLSDKDLQNVQLYIKHVDRWRDATTKLTDKELFRLNEKLEEMRMAGIAAAQAIDAAFKSLERSDTAAEIEKIKKLYKSFLEESFDMPDMKAQNKAFLETYDKRIDAIGLKNKELKKRQEKDREDEEEAENKHQQRMRDIREASFDAVYNLAGAFFDFNQAKRDVERAKIEEQAAFELGVVGNNEQAKNVILQRTEAEKKRLAAEEAKRQKALAIFDIAINTASAVVQALPNFVVAGIVGGVGLAQAALVAAAPLPGYNKGIKRVPGMLTNQDDHVARLTPGEMVVPAPVVNAYGPALNAIFDRTIDPDIINNIAKNRQPAPVIVNNDYSALVKAWKDNPHSTIIYDERGFHLYQQRKGQQIQSDAKRYKM